MQPMIKQGIPELYRRINRTYELLNHVLTFGADVLWRRQVIKALDGLPGLPERSLVCLDVCTGTGDMARLLRQRFNHGTPRTTRVQGTRIIGADFCPEMLYRARRSSPPTIQYLTAEAADLPFTDNTFDLLTLTFAMRNLRTSEPHLRECLAECYRVTKPGGRLVNLETSQPTSSLLRWGFHRYAKTLIQPIGGLVSGSRRAYAYLSQTIPRFYPASEFARLVADAGFWNVEYKLLWGGVAAIHIGRK